MNEQAYHQPEHGQQISIITGTVVKPFVGLYRSELLPFQLQVSRRVSCTRDIEGRI